ncbi:hypothetical protein [Aurantiacibacter zhengii]|uniref:Uncharacterized protein n=1 Tax=Aurantiacibacter zhengii TaxID=2307003 RepID=A0A418NSD0_9SPHN|nr:hypothetical protein [Aurantiacibacter zhengii]RIV86525.1 hypothetical protein D2V07_07305 [Aurantiacibacter zhengii]
MSRTDRRSAMLLAFVAGVAPALCANRALAAPLSGLIAPPDGPMRYSRTVVRQLADGREFSATRDFAVAFRRFDGGFMLSGQQTDVRIEAPAALEQFVRIERERDESGLFPIALDAFGQILSTQIAQPAGPDLRRAVGEALAQISSDHASADEREQLARYLSALQIAGNHVIAYLPTDLFAPASLSRRDEQRVDLPGGLQGTVESVFECERDASTGLMRAAARRIVTLVEGTSRTVREHWSLTR